MKGRTAVTTYERTHGSYDPDMASDSMNLVAYRRMARIIRELPEVDSWAIARYMSFPNSSSWSGTQVFADTASLHKDKGYVHAQRYEFVTMDGSNLLRTYGIKDARTGGDLRLPEQPADKVFISERLAERLFGTVDAVGKKVYQSDEPLEVAGVFRNFKHRDYEQPYPLFIGMQTDMQGSPYMVWEYSFVFRLKPGVDVSAFKLRFRQEVEPQLSIGNFYCDGLQDFSSLSEAYAMRSGVTNKLRLQYALTTFALLCIFLGMVGTFWIRSNARRGDIGVMRSMGASQGCIVRQFLLEAWMLLTVAFVLVIPFLYFHARIHGLYTVEMFDDFVLDPAYGQNRFGFHFTVVLVLSYLILLIVALIGTYIPVRRAARTLPLEALREE